MLWSLDHGLSWSVALLDPVHTCEAADILSRWLYTTTIITIKNSSSLSDRPVKGGHFSRPCSSISMKNDSSSTAMELILFQVIIIIIIIF